MLFIICMILYAGIELGPDEAQYWTWSQALDWGYYSKPPGIAWQIWLGTYLFGQNEWGVRSISVILALMQALAVYQLALAAGLLKRTAYWCSLIMAFLSFRNGRFVFLLLRMQAFFFVGHVLV